MYIKDIKDIKKITTIENEKSSIKYPDSVSSLSCSIICDGSPNMNSKIHHTY